ncbi:cell division protein PerM [Tessaracoccus caeni]|uniref:cell division protein PerM n=1 Tax=Tessaracoccus caeni TaxID=3031239 RepID=UPI0023DCBED3|nr:DUF6350 family protein [Tessaracoccus caeni]MDF1488864.1 DUF6350 family protein [Tessaracoccus caeni]
MAERNSTPRTVTVDLDAAPPRPHRRVPGPWWALAGGGALVVLVAGWIIVGGAITVGWLVTPDATFAPVLRLATQGLALAHGVPAQIAPITVGIAPLGLTLVLMALAVPITSLAARQAASDSGKPDDTGRIWVDVEPFVLRVGLTFTATYTLGLVLVTTTVLGTGTGWNAVLGGVLVGGLAGFWGAARGVGYDLTARVPAWARALPRALTLSSLALLAGGAAVLTYALWSGRAQVESLMESLGGGAVGGVLLLLLQLAYLPNAVLWGISFVLGSGVRLGELTSLSMQGSEVGFLPALPIFGAVPEQIGQWAYAWLVVGLFAGAVAGAVVVLDRPRAHPLETTAAGAIAGLVAAVPVVLAGLVSGGALGTERLAWLGPDLGRLVVFPPAVLGLAGALAGLAIGLWIRPPDKPEDKAPAQEGGSEAVS